MKKIISIVAIFLLIINFNLVQNVYADENPSGFVKLDDFDSYLIDDKSGSTEGFSVSISDTGRLKNNDNTVNNK